MAKLTFYGGVGEIGGNKILLEDRNTRIFLDFGRSFCAMNHYFGGFLLPRSVNGVGDYLEFDTLPRLEGLYRNDILNGFIKPHTSPQFDAVFISHPHIDHIGCLSFLDENIPVYCGEIAKLIIEAVEESSPGADFGRHNFVTFHTGDRLKVGDLGIEPVHVDHSVPGAYGFIIHTSIGPIVYTGDLRLHGPRADMTKDFIDKARAVKPIILISEATRVMPEDKRQNYSEEDVGVKIGKIVRESKGLVIATFYGRDLDRFKTFYRIAKETNKKFVISTRLAQLLLKVRGDSRFEIPDVLQDDTLLVYKRRKKSGEYIEQDYLKWERAFLDRAVTFEYVRQYQTELIFNLDFFSFPELVDIRPGENSCFIHSMSEPFSEEDLNDELMHRWLEHFKVEFHQVHASGHCSGSDIKEIIRQIAPQKYIPIHTEYPGMLKGIVSETLIPQKGVTYEF